LATGVPHGPGVGPALPVGVGAGPTTIPLLPPPPQATTAASSDPSTSANSPPREPVTA
jgi:hypothetical protein